MKRFFQILSHNSIYLIYFLFSVAVFLRVYQFGWGSPFFFHPDERNIAMAVTRLSLDGLSPEFFAYGSLPIYLTYGIGIVVNVILSFTGVFVGTDVFVVGFDHAILISRLFSAVLSIGVIYLVYRMRARLSANVFWVVFLLSVFSVGYIQYAHFGTFEMWLTFFGFLLFYLLYLFYISKKFTVFVWCCVVFGVLMSVKVSSVILFPALVIPVVYLYRNKGVKQVFRKIFIFSLTGVLISGVIFLLTNPYFILDNASYMSSLSYESRVATGELPVFYTGRFFDTVPVWFAFLRVFPFLINPLNTLLLLLSVGVCGYMLYRKKSFFVFFVLLFFLLLFLPQAFLFVKWNRYMVPTLPFVYLLIAFGADYIAQLLKKERAKMFRKVFLAVGSVVAVIFSFSFFVTVYLQEDTRTAAAEWATLHIRPSAPILTEVYDLGVVPFERNFSAISLINAYEFGNGEEAPDLMAYEYVLLPSPRILRSRLANPERFPEGEKFYSTLVEERGGYKLVYQTPCDILCQITYLGDPVYLLEETSNVFDRPSVFIYENARN